MKLLGISAFHRDSAAALVVDGKPVVAVQEDRFTKRLQDESFPTRAARACLSQAGLTMRDIDGIVFYEKPLRKFERVLATQLSAFPRSARSFSRNMFLWLGDRLWMKNRIADELEFEDTSKIYFTEHQMSHAATAFYLSPHERAAVLTVDDIGEWATTTLCRGAGTSMEVLQELRFPHSLGLFVSAIAQYLGLEPGAQDHQLEALAAHGTPRFLEAFEQLLPAGEDGSFIVKQSAFRYSFDHELLFTDELEQLLGPARLPTAPMRYLPGDSRDADVAASLQAVLELRVLALCERLHTLAPEDALCFAGRLADNRGLCARILKDGPFETLFVPPCPDDAGAAIGAALFAHHALSKDAPRNAACNPFLGMAIEKRPEEGAVDVEDGPATVLERLIAGERVAWVRGRHELGERSLGHRSLLADPRPANARNALLESVQHAEPFLPIRVAVCEEQAAEYFELPAGGASPARLAQLFVPATDKLKQHAPSALRPDGSAWPQVVSSEDDPEFHALLTKFAEHSGAPLLLHETFSLRGSPIVRVEGDAHDAFQRSSLDSMVVETRLYERASVK